MLRLDHLIQPLREAEVKALSDEQKRIKEAGWLRFPRAATTFGARFELPIDLRLLKSNRQPLTNSNTTGRRF